MALSDRLTTAIANRSNRGCVTCQWLDELPAADRDAFTAWISAGKSVLQLHELCVTDPDHPLPVSFTALRNHVRNHHES